MIILFLCFYFLTAEIIGITNLLINWWLQKIILCFNNQFIVLVISSFFVSIDVFLF